MRNQEIALMKLRIAIVLSICLQLIGTAYASQFRASAVEVDITPSTPQWLAGYSARQSDGVHDRLFHRIAVLDDGKTTIFFVSTDTCLLSPGFVDKVKQDIQQQLGIPPQSIWWVATHTHSAPEIGPPGNGAMFMPERYKQAAGGESNAEYTEFAEAKLIEGLRLAQQQLQAARLGFGIGFSTANINRRAVDADGKVSLGLNPDGPTDRQIGLIRIESLKGKLLGLLANYPIHGTDLGPANLKISGDVPGVVVQYVEDKLGAPMVFINGAEGNLAPIYSVYPDFKSGHLGEFRVLLGDRILEANQRIVEMTSEVVLTASEVTIETPLRAGLAWPPELGKYVRTPPGGTTLVRIPVQFLQINQEVVLWGAPLELFCQVATDVRNASRFPFTFYAGLLNGWFGYLPTKQAFLEQGYEPATSPFTGNAEDDLRQGVTTHLASLMR
jgi:neutral ceramidase